MKNRKLNKKEMVFSISAVAKMLAVHQQTIRAYEKSGLLQPKRSDGNTRLFSEEDIHQLEEILYLTHQMGINLAGVKMILKLKKQIARMQKDINKIFSQTQQTLTQESQKSENDIQEGFMKLLQLKKNHDAVGKKGTPLSLQSLLQLGDDTKNNIQDDI